MRYGLNNHGFAKIVHLILIVLFLLLLIPGIKPYYYYFALSWYADNTLKMNAGNATVIRENIMNYAVKKGIPLAKDNLRVYREQSKVKVKISWSDEINLYGYYRKPLTFVIDDMF